MSEKVEVTLPNGMILISEPNGDPSYPGIQISLKGTGPDETNETLCFVEYNKEKPAGKELCICAYTCGQDDYVYYAGYHGQEDAIE